MATLLPRRLSAALLSSPRNAQVALLLEAAMIGFLAAKKTS